MNRSLVGAGFFSLLLGLLTGVAIPALTIPRLGVSAHLLALIGGVVLAVVGLVWGSLTLGGGTKRLLFWLWITAIYGNWTVTLLSGVFGGSHFMPIASGGATAEPVINLVLSVSIVIISLIAVIATILVLWGLRGPNVEKD